MIIPSDFTSFRASTTDVSVVQQEALLEESRLKEGLVEIILSTNFGVLLI